MTALDAVRFFIESGAGLSARQAQAIHTYFHALLSRGRVVELIGSGQLVACATFFLLEQSEDLYALYQRPVWSTPADAPGGTLIYFDLVAARHWTKALRADLTALCCLRFPQLQDAYWHRLGALPAQDRLVHWPIPQEVAYAHHL